MTAQALTLADMKPEQDKAEDSRRFWDRTARKYAKGKISDQASYDKSLARTRDYFAKDSDVVEIGGGTGTTALLHAPFVKHITGTDISSEMVAIAREKTAESGPLNADFIAAVADDLPFANASFDVAMAHNLYHLVEDVDAALREAHRILKPGGVFITKTPALGDMNPFIKWVVLPVMQRIYGITTLHKFTKDEWQQALARAGFTIDAVEYHDKGGENGRAFIVARK
ncbi:MAG: methyltransferase domain-containing protein [Pseudomonadota bacterium]